MAIKEIAERINSYSDQYEMSGFQLLRKKIKQLSRMPTSKIFHQKSIFDAKGYAFHAGGSDEFQFNIGLEGDKFLRYGMAFSLQETRALSDPLTVLAPKIDRYNQYFEQHSSDFSDIYYWYYQNGKRSRIEKARKVSGAIIQPDTFIFSELKLISSKFRHNNKRKALCLPDFPSFHWLKHRP